MGNKKLMHYEITATSNDSTQYFRTHRYNTQHSTQTTTQHHNVSLNHTALIFMFRRLLNRKAHFAVITCLFLVLGHLLLRILCLLASDCSRRFFCATMVCLTTCITKIIVIIIRVYYYDLRQKNDCY